MKQKNYYEILQVGENASDEEIKKAYRKLAKEYHPDRHPDDPTAETKFKEIGEAYDVLKDKEKRRKYDELRRYGSGKAPESMSYEEFMNRFGGYQQDTGAEEFNWGFGGGLEDIFSELFGGATRRSAKSTRRGGRTIQFDFGDMREGSSTARSRESHDSFFKRKGDDAYVDIPINLAQAMLGSTIRVRTPQGKRVNVKITPGTQPEAVLRVRGMGFNERGRPGDLYIRTHLSVPADMTEKQKKQAAALFNDMGLRY
ncbi:MAG: J domain-containing protein [Bacteroidetes bacterium]|nr:J domain-containing protein [Bacteroidota bacterium]